MKSGTLEQKFQKALQPNKGIIHKVCNTYASDPEDRKDLFQEILVQLWRSFPRYDPSFKFTTWMYRVALNVAISWFRKHSKITVTSLDNIKEDYSHDPGDNQSEELSLLDKFISELDPLNKALMILYLDDNSYQEISEVLGITETNVATKINRIKKYLKTRFETLNK